MFNIITHTNYNLIFTIKVFDMWYWYEQVVLGLFGFSLIQFIQFYILEEDIVIYLIKKMQGKK